jgi:hypothetical protein
LRIYLIRQHLPNIILINLQFKFLNKDMLPAQAAANMAIVLSLIALVSCGMFIPALIAKINTITADLEAVSFRYRNFPKHKFIQEM